MGLVAVVVFHLLLDNFLLFEGIPGINSLKLTSLALLFGLALWGQARPSVTDPEIAILVILVSLFLITLVPVLTSQNVASSLYGSAIYFIKVPVFFATLTLAFASPWFQPRALVNTWVALSLVFALQSLLLLLILFGFKQQLPTFSVALPRLGEVRTSLGPLGFFDSPPRVQSYFSEANMLAQFLIPPFFVILARKHGHRTVGILVVGLALIATFSFSTLGGIAVGVLVYTCIRVRARVLRTAAVAFGVVTLAIVGPWVINNILRAPPTENPTVYRMLYRAQSVAGEAAMLERGFQIANDNPFGIGHIRRTDAREYDYGRFNTASGVLYALATGGWPGLLLHGLIWLVVFRCVLAAAEGVREGRLPAEVLALGCAFISLAVAQTTHGPYNQRLYILLLALFLATLRVGFTRSPPGDQLRLV